MHSATSTVFDGQLEVSPLFPGGSLPMLVTPGQGGQWPASMPAMLAAAQAHLDVAGGLLFRGFGLHGEQPFQQFARAFGHELLTYEFGSTPRSALGKGVYTSTEYPAHQVIPLHCEQSYTRQWPMKIWFHCIVASAQDGETPIADSRQIFARIDPVLRRRFEQKRLMYVRNYGNGLDLPWQDAFNTDDRTEAERYCRAQDIAFEWKDDGELRTRQVCQAVARHPRTGQDVWFNQAHLFHVSNLAPAVRESLLMLVDSDLDLPRNVYYGDGSPIEESALQEIRGVLDACTVMFPWVEGDVLMLDNMLAAHGRSTFKGARKIVVAMAEAAHE
jgi:alpha-ketoglutarate-dependent taurine dioxygenase